MKIERTAIIGAGSWGTALAWLWGKDGRQISLWGNDAGRVERMLKTRENSDYIPGLKLPNSVMITHELRDCAGADLVILVTVGINLAQQNASLLGAVPFVAATIFIAALPVLSYLLFRRRAQQVMPKVRDWMNTHSWLVNIIVYVVFIVLILF